MTSATVGGRCASVLVDSQREVMDDASCMYLGVVLCLVAASSCSGVKERPLLARILESRSFGWGENRENQLETRHWRKGGRKTNKQTSKKNKQNKYQNKNTKQN